jgi:hydrogenase-4 component B
LSAVAFAVALGAAGAAVLLGAGLPVRVRTLAAVLLSAIACLAALLAAGDVLVTGQSWTVRIPELLPLTGVSLSLDALSALFVATTAAVGLAASFYTLGYAAHGSPSRTVTAMLPAFLASLLLVPVAASVATFMLAWELMALTSLLLLLTDHHRRVESRDAGQWYAAMTHIGAAAILVGLILLATAAGGQTFATIAAHRGVLSPAVRSTVFVLTLVGFASKAGAVPLHVWLPRAHPEAPSPVSALMSGAMVNLGVYGILRVGAVLLGGGDLWWWVLVAGLGAISAVFGALHATASSDLKRLLAYSTVDNIGLILVGVGAAGSLATTGEPLLASLALMAALFQLVNHSLFKGCLFLGAGAVQHATGTRDLDQLGGLARRLPLTAALFGVGALAITAVPGLNGFASEWLLLESFLHGFADPRPAAVITLLAGVAVLAITGGLTVVAFVKAFGVGFLGQPRTPAAGQSHEVAPSMLTGMGLLAALCLGLGLAPGLVLPPLDRAVTVALAVRASAPLRPGIGLALAGRVGAIEPALVVVGLMTALVVGWSLLRLAARPSGLAHPRASEAWGCGREVQTARMEITATSFAEPLQRVFVDVLRPDHDVEVTHADESRYFPQALTYQSQIDDALELSLYRPVIDAVVRWGRLARRVPNGSVHRYLAFGFVTLILVLALVVLA